MGARFRLKQSFDISGFSATNQIILTALKRYGMLLADNGSSWYISGAPDARWNNDDLHALTGIAGSNFEAVDDTTLMVDPNSGQASQSLVSVSVSPVIKTSRWTPSSSSTRRSPVTAKSRCYVGCKRYGWGLERGWIYRFDQRPLHRSGRGTLAR
jgi:hypothetical protein